MSRWFSQFRRREHVCWKPFRVVVELYAVRGSQPDPCVVVADVDGEWCTTKQLVPVAAVARWWRGFTSDDTVKSS